jgi:hypothetical protein
VLESRLQSFISLCRAQVTIDYSISSWVGYINATFRGKPVAIARFPLVYGALQHHDVDTTAMER